MLEEFKGRERESERRISQLEGELGRVLVEARRDKEVVRVMEQREKEAIEERTILKVQVRTL